MGKSKAVGPFYAIGELVRDVATDAIVARMDEGGHVDGEEIFSLREREALAEMFAALPDVLKALNDVVYQKPGDAGAYGRAANLLHRLGAAGAQ